MLDRTTIDGAVADAAGRYDIAQVFLFGSYARGSAGESSDVDLAIEAGPGLSLFDVGGFQQDLESALGAPVDVADASCLRPFVRRGFERDKVLIYDR